MSAAERPTRREVLAGVAALAAGAAVPPASADAGARVTAVRHYGYAASIVRVRGA